MCGGERLLEERPRRVDGRDGEVGLAELALQDVHRHALADELDGVAGAQLDRVDYHTAPPAGRGTPRRAGSRRRVPWGSTASRYGGLVTGTPVLALQLATEYR